MFDLSDARFLEFDVAVKYVNISEVGTTVSEMFERHDVAKQSIIR